MYLPRPLARTHAHARHTQLDASKASSVASPFDVCLPLHFFAVVALLLHAAATAPPRPVAAGPGRPGLKTPPSNGAPPPPFALSPEALASLRQDTRAGPGGPNYGRA